MHLFVYVHACLYMCVCACTRVCIYPTGFVFSGSLLVDTETVLNTSVFLSDVIPLFFMSHTSVLTALSDSFAFCLVVGISKWETLGGNREAGDGIFIH